MLYSAAFIHFDVSFIGLTSAGSDSFPFSKHESAELSRQLSSVLGNNISYKVHFLYFVSHTLLRYYKLI